MAQKPYVTKTQVWQKLKCHENTNCSNSKFQQNRNDIKPDMPPKSNYHEDRDFTKTNI